MFSGGTGRTISIANNVLATLLTIYLLYTFDVVAFAILIIVFALSVSVTQCKSRLPITLPVILLNAIFFLVGLGYSFYRIFYTEPGNPEMTMLSIIILLSISAAINLLIIRTLHYKGTESG